MTYPEKSDPADSLELPARFSYDRGLSILYGFLLSLAFFGAFIYATMSETTFSYESLVILAGGIFFGSCAVIMAFGVSTVALDDDGIRWSMLGWNWRYIPWPDVSQIKIFRYATYRDRRFEYGNDRTQRAYAIVTRGRKFPVAGFDEDIENLAQLKMLINKYIRKFGIRVVSEEAGGTTDEAAI